MCLSIHSEQFVVGVIRRGGIAAVFQQIVDALIGSHMVIKNKIQRNPFVEILKGLERLRR